MNQKTDAAKRHLQEQIHQIKSQQEAAQAAQANSTNAAGANAIGNKNPNALAGWQSDRDIPERRSMIQRIVQLLQQRKPNAPEEWVKKLPVMAKRLEESLYRNAASFIEYNDTNTLKSRLQRLAMNIGWKSQVNKLLQQRDLLLKKEKEERTAILTKQQQQREQQQQDFQNKYRQVFNEAANVAGQLVKATQQQKQKEAARQAKEKQQAALKAHQQKQQQQIQQQAQQQQQQRSQQPQMVDMSAINPLISAPKHQQPSNNNTTNNNKPTVPTARSQADRQQVLRHQQQRLLLLRHAAKCPHEGDSRCPVTPHCAGMKKLWKHIAECKNQKCLVPRPLPVLEFLSS